MSSSSRGSGPERRGSRRQRVAGSRGRPQSRAREPESQEPGDQGPESQEPGDQGPGSEVGQPGEPEEADTGAADATSGAGDPDAGRAEDPESGTAETGDAEDDSDSSPGEDPATEQVAQLPADGSDGQHSGASDSASDDSTGGSVDEDGAVEDAEAPQRGRFRLRMAMLAAAAVLAGFGAWFAYETITLHTSGAAANDALVDAGATSEVNGQVGEAVTKLFSYNFAEADKADAAADELLVGPAVDKYNELWGVLRKQAPEQKLVVDTAVKSSAVTWLQGDRAEVLLYVDQKATRAGNEEGQNEPAQLTVGAEKHGDQWKINRISLR